MNGLQRVLLAQTIKWAIIVAVTKAITKSIEEAS